MLENYSNAGSQATALLTWGAEPDYPAMLKPPIGAKVDWMLQVARIPMETIVQTTGVSGSSAVYEWRRTGRMAKKHIPALARLTGTTESWWLTDDSPIPPSGPWLLAPGASPRSADTIRPVTRTNEPSAPADWQDWGEPLPLPVARAVPVVGTAQLGDDGHYVELEYPVGQGDGSVLALTGDPHAYAVRCRGDSMMPRLQHGEFAVIEPSREVTPGDEVLVKSLDGRVMIKRLRYQRDGRLHLDSVNDGAHPPVILELDKVAAMHYVAAIVKNAYYRPA
jgi:phage repressor protein C with HTH and peptisase S24 domain